jgi:hypothetical protein
LCTTLAAALAVAEPPDDPGAGSPAAQSGVWQKHEYSFVFMGFTSVYSCDGLAGKLKQLLITAGARADAKVRPGPCAVPFGRPDKLARADLTFYTLAAGAGSDAAGAPVDAVWKKVSLSNHEPRYLAIGDCELVDQFRSAILPMFTTRAVDNHTTCVPHQESGSNIDLKFESLTVPPTAPQKKG